MFSFSFSFNIMMICCCSIDVEYEDFGLICTWVLYFFGRGNICRLLVGVDFFIRAFIVQLISQTSKLSSLHVYCNHLPTFLSLVFFLKNITNM